MRNILIFGGGGMVGQKLAQSLADDPLEAGDRVSLCDLHFPDNGAPVAEQITGTVTNPGVIKRLAASRPDIVFYLAAIVSGEAERDFDLGWQVNMAAFQSFVDHFREEAIASGGDYKPKVIFKVL